MKSFKHTRFVAATVMAILLLASFLIGNMTQGKVADAAPEKSPNIISVSGEGRVKVKPDLAYINLGVQTQNQNAKTAQAENAEKMKKVMDSLKKQGIKEEDIKTTQYSIYPNHYYNPSTGKSSINGYTVHNMVQVIVRDIEMTGTIVDMVTQNDSNMINGIELGIGDTNKYYLEALKKATEDAKNKADAIASAVNVKVTKPSKIIETGNSNPIYYTNAKFTSTEAMDRGTPISAGMLEVSAFITAEFEY